MQHSEQAGLDPLAERLADGDSRAARDLVERHYTGLYRYAFAMLRGEQEAVEDAVQDAFERALRALGMYPEERIRAMGPRLAVRPGDPTRRPPLFPQCGRGDGRRIPALRCAAR
jgi:hypothetical protein